MRILWWLLAIAGVSLVSIILSEQRTLDPLQNFSLRITSPLEQGLRDLADPIAELVEGVADHGDLVRENQRLRLQLEELQAQEAAQEDARLRVRELEEALNVRQSRPEEQFLVASVIAQDPSGLKRAVAIDRGASDGLDEGMVVLSQGGSLVGTVSRLYDDFAWVRLVTDPESAINARVQVEGTSDPSEARGLAQGNLRRSLVLDMIPPETAVAEGNLVTTSGLGGNYPPALLIGSVTTVDERPQALFKRATVEPAVDLSALQTVLVMISFRPARLEGP